MTTRVELAERVTQLERMLKEARAERDRFELAVRWALGECPHGTPDFVPRREGQPAYWWRRPLRGLAFDSRLLPQEARR